MRYSEAIQLWRDGERRLRGAEPESRVVLQRVIDALVDELHRRLGGAFTTTELAELYDQGTDWCFEVAVRIAPADPEAWDMPTVCGTAFARYAREASDYRPAAAERPPGMVPE
ncbi:MAG TPA: hypothetical protein VGY32_13595 [Solirubrobacteraceae bacterium]|jgi:hypothetical protein|nr:hypothetical protein [Solirubrobacteraceae bacterium]